MEFTYESNRIYLNNQSGEMVAEVTFPADSDGRVNINHTFVDDSLRGQGVAGKLLSAAAEQLKKEHKKVVCTCSYAVSWFEKHPEYEDLLK